MHIHPFTHIHSLIHIHTYAHHTSTHTKHYLETLLSLTCIFSEMGFNYTVLAGLEIAKIFPPLPSNAGTKVCTTMPSYHF